MAVESVTNLETPSQSLPDASRSDSARQGRERPHNIEAEQALLGAILLNNDALDRVTDFLEERHFYEPLHGRIYSAAQLMFETGRLASPVSLLSFFSDDPAIEEIGGANYLSHLTETTASIINTEQYGRLIYELALRRMLMSVGEDIYNRAHDAPIDLTPLKQVEEAEKALYAIIERGHYAQGFKNFHTVLGSVSEMARAARERDSRLSGLATGLADLDQKLGGLQPSDLIVIAGRPSMGKSALAANIALHIAKSGNEHKKEDIRFGGPVGFFSLEMSDEQVATRILAEQAEISSERIRRGIISKDEFNRFAQACHELQNLPFFLDHTGAIPIATLAARARRLKREYGLALVVVDYLQLATPSHRRSNDGRVQEISEITQGLKALAKELEVPVLALSQLSRQVESREDKHPQLSDLRESGSIEQDADVVLFIYRDEYYLEQTKPDEGTPEHAKWQEKMERAHGLAELMIAKHRHGPTGVVRLQFQADLTRFSDYIPASRLPEATY